MGKCIVRFGTGYAPTIRCDRQARFTADTVQPGRRELHAGPEPLNPAAELEHAEHNPIRRVDISVPSSGYPDIRLAFNGHGQQARLPAVLLDRLESRGRDLGGADDGAD